MHFVGVHWLSVSFCNQFKVLILTYKCLYLVIGDCGRMGLLSVYQPLQCRTLFLPELASP